MKKALNLSHYKKAILAGLGASICISGLSLLSDWQTAALVMAPFGATMVILFGLPESPLAQPRNIIAGHMLTAAIGLLMASYAGVTPLTMGFAVGIAVTLMLLTGTTHPPAGANPLLIMLTGEDWHFLFTPVAIGACSIVAFGYIYHNWISRHPYPQRWL